MVEQLINEWPKHFSVSAGVVIISYELHSTYTQGLLDGFHFLNLSHSRQWSPTEDALEAAGPSS